MRDQRRICDEITAIQADMEVQDDARRVEYVKNFDAMQQAIKDRELKARQDLNDKKVAAVSDLAAGMRKQREIEEASIAKAMAEYDLKTKNIEDAKLKHAEQSLKAISVCNFLIITLFNYLINLFLCIYLFIYYMHCT